MSSLFYDKSWFNDNINNWDVSNVTDMFCTFYYAISFNQLLDKWNVCKVTDMRYMFNEASDFNQPLNTWDVSDCWVNGQLKLRKGKSFYKHVLGLPTDFSDIEANEPDYYKS
jgi:surface protein